MSNKIIVIGNVVNSPARKRTQNGSVTNFRIASTERRFDGATQTWIDSSTFFVDVECWGDLGGNVSHSVSKGDPVVVVGALRTDHWDSDQGRRSRSQIRAEAVALNLARGVAEFRRTQRATAAAVPEQPREPGDDAFDALLAGRDYEADAETLHDMNPDDLSPEPAHA